MTILIYLNKYFKPRTLFLIYFLILSILLLPSINLGVYSHVVAKILTVFLFSILLLINFLKKRTSVINNIRVPFLPRLRAITLYSHTRPSYNQVKQAPPAPTLF